MIICPKCQANNPIDAPHCKQCGYPLNQHSPSENIYYYVPKKSRETSLTYIQLIGLLVAIITILVFSIIGLSQDPIVAGAWFVLGGCIVVFIVVYVLGKTIFKNKSE